MSESADPEETHELIRQALAKKVPGLVDTATVSTGFSMHLPKGVVGHWNIEEGDVLRFYNQFTDIPDVLAENFRLIAVVIQHKSDVLPIGPPFMPGKHLTRVSK